MFHPHLLLLWAIQRTLCAPFPLGSPWAGDAVRLLSCRTGVAEPSRRFSWTLGLFGGGNKPKSPSGMGGTGIKGHPGLVGCPACSWGVQPAWTSPAQVLYLPRLCVQSKQSKQSMSLLYLQTHVSIAARAGQSMQSL